MFATSHSISGVTSPEPVAQPRHEVVRRSVVTRHHDHPLGSAHLDHVVGQGDGLGGTCREVTAGEMRGEGKGQWMKYRGGRGEGSSDIGER